MNAAEERLQEVLAAFDLGAPVVGALRYGQGHINDTFVVHTQPEDRCCRHPPEDERRRLQAPGRTDGEHYRRHRVPGPGDREARRGPEPGGHGGPSPPERPALLHRQRRRGLAGLSLRGAHRLLPVRRCWGATRRRPSTRPSPISTTPRTGWPSSRPPWRRTPWAGPRTAGRRSNSCWTGRRTAPWP